MPQSGNPFRQAVRVLGLYIRSQFIISGIETLLYALGFAVARVPLWPVFAVIGGICSLIPTVGALITLALVGLTMLVADRNWTHVAIAFGTWLVIQAVEGFVLQPMFLGRPLGLGAIPVFLALLIASVFFGPLGLVFAVPVLAVANVFWQYFRNRNSSQSS